MKKSSVQFDEAGLTIVTGGGVGVATGVSAGTESGSWLLPGRHMQVVEQWSCLDERELTAPSAGSVAAVAAVLEAMTTEVVEAG